MHTFDFELYPGTNVKLSELTWGQSERFIKSGNELRQRGAGATSEDWLNRMAQLVADSLTAANGTPHGPYEIEGNEGLKENFSLREIRAMHDAILEHSGLKVTEPGEATATAPSGSRSAVA